MADIRIIDLPEEDSPVATEWVALDAASTRKVRIGALVDAGAPIASQQEAEDGVNPSKRMTPLTTKQHVDARVGVDLATAEQGQKADTAIQPDTLAAPLAYKGNIIDFDSLRGSNDTLDMWTAALKPLLEQPSSERTALMGGARLFLRGGRAYRALARSLITVPRYLHIEMEPGAIIDFSETPGIFADNLFSYNGRLGTPTRPVNADIYSSARSVTFGAGVVASRGWKAGDRLLIRATEGLKDNLVGAFQTMSMDASVPDEFSFYTPGSTYAVGAGVISVDNGNSYRCTVAHTAGPVMNLANFQITGYNATGEDLFIEAIVGDTVYFNGYFRYNYPVASRPVFCRFEDEGVHRFTGFNFVGNFPTDLLDRGAWGSGQSYSVGEMVENGDRYHRCLVNHTSSGSFAVDQAAGYWQRLGSDRLFRFGNNRELVIEGGKLERLSGYAIATASVGKLIVRDVTGDAGNKRDGPGGFFAIAGASHNTTIENVTVYGGSQPFMTTETGGDYGILYGTLHRDCRAIGGKGGFSQHWQEDGGVYDNCEHVSGVNTTAGGGFDIRTPSFLRNCRVLNHPGRAVVLRHNFMGFNRPDNSARGTTIEGFNAHNCLSGIVLDNQMFNHVATRRGWPEGYLHFEGCKFTQIGGTGSGGGINMTWTQPVTAGGTDYPELGNLTIRNTLIEVKSNFHVVKLEGRWERPVIDGLTVKPSPGFTPSGAFRSVWITGVAGNRANNPSLERVNAVGAFNQPLFEANFTDATPSIASAGTISINVNRSVFNVTGTTTVSFIDNVAASSGMTKHFVFGSALTVRHNNGGVGAIVLKSGADTAFAAGAMLSVVSDGVKWRQL